MANPEDILRQYGPDPLPYPEEQPSYAPPKPPSNDGTLFRIGDNGDLQFKPWESIKNFMSYRTPPGALSTSGDSTPIENAFDTAGWVGLPGLGLSYSGALPAIDKMATGAMSGVFAGTKGAQNLAKQGIHAPQKAIEMAERMKAEGATPSEIWQATARFMEKEDPRFSAVHFGKEGAPQFEIPDYQAKWPARMADEWEMRNFMESRPGETLDHPLLYAAYPEMRNVPMTATARPRFPNEGAFDPGTFPGDIRDARFSVSGPTPEKARSAAIHEFDHGTAFIEGHARGSSPERAAYVIDPNDREIRSILAERDFLTKQFEKSVPGEDPHYRSRKADLEFANQSLDARAKELGYKRSAGETRARTAQESANMTPEQLRAKPPWERQDVPYDQQILEMYGDPRTRADGGEVQSPPWYDIRSAALEKRGPWMRDYLPKPVANFLAQAMHYAPMAVPAMRGRVMENGLRPQDFAIAERMDKSGVGFGEPVVTGGKPGNPIWREWDATGGGGMVRNYRDSSAGIAARHPYEMRQFKANTPQDSTYIALPEEVGFWAKQVPANAPAPEFARPQPSGNPHRDAIRLEEWRRTLTSPEFRPFDVLPGGKKD